ncbi:hypothetical protein FRC12_012760 [Ceratobasidium sp. 428]|nr:hypothetical protein FRC12_012760 [Ceratobasidium sp. 428]
MVPGTYQIINTRNGMALEAGNNDAGTLFCGEKNSATWQKAQCSGAGWRIKSCDTGRYLTVSKTDNCSEVYGGKYPISWELCQGPRDHDIYVIKFAGSNRGLELAGGRGGPGDRIELFHHADNTQFPKWRFERFDDTSAEERQTTRGVIDKDQKLTDKDQQLATMERQLADKEAQLVNKGLQLASKDAQLGDKHRELMEMAEKFAMESQRVKRLNADLQSTQARLTEATERLASKDQEVDRLRYTVLASSGESERRDLQDALGRAQEAARDRDIELLKLQNQMLREKMDKVETGVSEQRRETEELRETVRNLEHFLMQVSTAS